MPKYRQLYTKIIDSFDFNEMPDDFTRVVWLMLPLILDCEGRGIGNMAWVKSKLFPLREDITVNQLEASFKWLETRKMVVFYQVEGHLYFYIPTFKTYQKGTEYETSSLLPAPLEETLNQSQGNFKVAAEEPPPAESASASASASESASESESVLKRPEIFTIYEKEIGILSPMIADKLKDAEKEYPIEYIIKAFQEAATHNKRSWGYAEAILKRWKIEGFNTNGKKPNKKHDPHAGLTQQDRDRYDASRPS